MISNGSLKEVLSKEYKKHFTFYDNDKYLGIYINKENVFSLIKKLKDFEKLKFRQLMDITAIDYPSREIRFDVVYILLSLSINKRIVIKTAVNINETIDSITPLYKSSNWYERECYDLFGIKFANHPDLRRIMTDYNFEGHPLRKDFPLTGHTEVRYDNSEKRVIYEPVKLSQEYRYLDYSSPWEGIPNQLKISEINKKKEGK